jgi:DNA-directed RNA polymerase subunit RPC12/RpoP
MMDDLISRQQTLDAIKNMCDECDSSWCGDCRVSDLDGDVFAILRSLPSAQPEPQEGHWIPHETPDGGEQYECSECGVLWEFNNGTPEDNEAFYCPNCGAKMKGEQDGH